ncbi:hypothetical protein SPSYN_02790 [Sporotomaculum syntrophicum]|uniref:DUF2178 domain-containing protein n=1 Tax=Sporotomaculum syntrophicum TaxID=182264 RepID=A0A9D3AXQ0_9FIRM|nr:DUF2178 domain-containing protein [Sporotomaculum syntrophicum]KAF1083878.1 hypothetical protein SPSYN_02790 [Sporotomaculum syntrophicum]
MTTQARFKIGTGFQVVLLALGIWAVYLDKVGLGTGLIAATLAVFVVRNIKTKKIKEQQDQGLNPYDERVYYITRKAAYAACSTFLIASALFVLIGSIFGPEITVNPYNMLGMVIFVLVLLHIGFYYYFNSKE